MIRNITGYGEGNGAYISIFEGFIGVDKWYSFGQAAESGFDRVNMDIHQYTVCLSLSRNMPRRLSVPSSVSKTRTLEASRSSPTDLANGGLEELTPLETPLVSR